MAGKPKPPRLLRWRGHWHLFVTDPQTRRQTRVRCGSHGAVNEKQRKNMLAEALAEWHAAANEVRIGGLTHDYRRPLRAALSEYLADVQRRKALREVAGGTEGLAAKSARRIVEVVGAFRDTLPEHVTTGQLDPMDLRRWFDAVALRTSSGTANVYRRTLRAAIKWLAQRRPRLFPDTDGLWPAFKLARVEREGAVAFTPTELRAFRDRLPDDQRRLFLFLACTGCRHAEAFTAELRGQVLVLRATKTGRVRYLPLAGAPEGSVAPGLLRAIPTWDLVCGAERYSRHAWEAAGPIRPQMLRRNFTSYAASLGIPPAVVAMWQGHSAAVAEQYYRQQVMARSSAASIQSAMGL